MKVMTIVILGMLSFSSFASEVSKYLFEVEVTSGTLSLQAMKRQNIESVQEKLSLACEDLGGTTGALNCKNSRTYYIPDTNAQTLLATACSTLCKFSINVPD